MFSEVGEIRQHEIYARHLVIREGEPGIHQYYPATLTDGGHVLADLTQSPQGDYLNRSIFQSSRSFS
jgi:hypothetical protein